MLHQLRVKLVNVIGTNYAFNPDNKKSPKEVQDELGAVVDEIFDALGSCEICYGRGYVIETGELCECPRGKALGNFIKKEDYEMPELPK